MQVLLGKARHLALENSTANITLGLAVNPRIVNQTKQVNSSSFGYAKGFISRILV
jgi:hypothetical protein